MTELTITQAQAEMRNGYLDGAPGILVSGLAWLVSGLFSLFLSDGSAVLALLLGGALIYPLSVVVAKLLGRRGGHSIGNPLGRLAVEGTFWMLAGIAIAYSVYVLRQEWFFPAMLLIVGGRYLTFQTLYGLRIYWICGAILCVAGLTLGVARAPMSMSVFAGAVIELIFAAIVFSQAKRSGAA